VSERVLLEEFDLPNQEFSIEELKEEHQSIQKQVNSNKLKDINYSLRRTQRSDSIDDVLEKLTVNNELDEQVRRTQDSKMLN